MGDTEIDHRLNEYWDWVAVALFLLVTIDMLTTLYAASAVGLAYESNPLMAWLFGQSIVLIVVIHIGAAAIASVLFYGLIELIRQTPPVQQWMMMRSLEAYLGLLIATGLFVFANNLSVIVLGRSLL